MTWSIIFAKNLRGEEIVKNQIRILQKEVMAKVAHNIDLLYEQGPILPMPYSKKIMPNLYELRIRGKQEIRIFYSFKNSNIFILHLFQKKTQKTPQKEINIAVDRLKSLT